MSIMKLHFDKNIKIRKHVEKVNIQIDFLKNDLYKIHAYYMEGTLLINVYTDVVRFPVVKGNGKKAFLDLRDKAVQIVENKIKEIYE